MTLAQVTAIYQVKILEWDRTRDYFVSQGTSLQCFKDDHSKHIQDMLSTHYPRLKKTVIITSGHDPDFGASGDWQAMKAALKGRSANLKLMQRGDKRHG